ncbi:MAG: nicotinamide mononucleotide transporter [Desulfotomaculaceae bacterium]|nr:nicotinamide mononucleotide transporter [Desulfotomaculaceae bacterium]
MQYLVYLATFLSCLGNVFIIRQNSLGFIIWILGNVVWIYVDLKTPGMAPQIIMMVVYAALNIWGLIEWRKGRNILRPMWEIKENITCADCGTVCTGYRLVKTDNYDKTKDSNPEWRCEHCRLQKLEELKNKGIKVE